MLKYFVKQEYTTPLVPRIALESLEKDIAVSKRTIDEAIEILEDDAWVDEAKALLERKLEREIADAYQAGLSDGRNGK